MEKQENIMGGTTQKEGLYIFIFYGIYGKDSSYMEWESNTRLFFNLLL